MKTDKHLLTANPFYILGATPRDTDQVLIERSVDIKLLTGIDTHEAQEALLTPSGRLDAEISFLPGVDEDTIRNLRTRLEEKTDPSGIFPAPVFDYQPDSALALLNGVSALLDTWPVFDAAGAAAAALCIAGICSMLKTSSVLEEINKDRKAGGREELNNDSDILIRLKEHERELVSRLCGRSEELSLKEQTRIQELLTDTFCDSNSRYYRMRTLDEMVCVHLAHKTGGERAKLEKKIREGIKEYRETEKNNYTGEKGDADKVRARIINDLQKDLSEWDVLSKPSRRIATAKGYTQEAAYMLFQEIHSFFIYLAETHREKVKKNDHGAFFYYLHAQCVIKAIYHAFWDLQPAQRHIVTENARIFKVDQGTVPRST